jgi:hypothetical protein
MHVLKAHMESVAEIKEQQQPKGSEGAATIERHTPVATREELDPE